MFRRTQTHQRRFLRRFTTATESARGRRLLYAGVGLAGLGVGQVALGSGKDFFEYGFVTRKVSDANNLAEFYGTEDFMQIFCVIPLVEWFLMRGAEFDDKGIVHTYGFPFGSMDAEMTFSEKEADLSGDGEEDTVVEFTKRERFTNFLPLLGTFWDIQLTFGYTRLEDGSCKITHRGESFSGFWLYRLLFHAHARYVMWATKRYVNSQLFNESDDVEKQEEFRRYVPVHEMKQLYQTIEKDLLWRLEDYRRLRTQGVDISPELLKELESVYAKLQSTNLTEPRGGWESLQQFEGMEVLITLPGGKSGQKIQLVIKDDQARELLQTSMKLLQPELAKQWKDGRLAGQFRRSNSVGTKIEYGEKIGQLRGDDALEHVLGGAASGNPYASKAPAGSTWSTLQLNITRRKKAVYEIIGEVTNVQGGTFEAMVADPAGVIFDPEQPM